MKRIINGRRFDTKAATEIATTGSGGSYNDFRCYEEKLYRTPRGNWFVHGHGGPMTRWGRAAVGGGTIEGEGILALTDKQALQWLEDAGEAALAEEYFDVDDA